MNISMNTARPRLRRLSVVIVSAAFALALAAPSRSSAAEGGPFLAVPAANPRYCGNELFRAFEDYYSPRMGRLRARYGLDAVLRDGKFRCAHHGVNEVWVNKFSE